MRWMLLIAALAAGPARAFSPDPGGVVAERLIAFTDPVPVPDVPFTAPDGSKARLSGWAGEVAIVTLWATWCEICREELPVLDGLAAARPGLAVVSISVDQVDPARTVARYLDAAGLTRLPAYLDRAGLLAARIGVRVTPTTLILSRHGEVVAAIEGRGPWEAAEMQDYLDALLAAEDAAAARSLLAAR